MPGGAPPPTISPTPPVARSSAFNAASLPCVTEIELSILPNDAAALPAPDSAATPMSPLTFRACLPTRGRVHRLGHRGNGFLDDGGKRISLNESFNLSIDA